MATRLEKPVADNSNSKWQRAGFLAGVFITVWIIALHVLNLFHAGPLWRDEAGTVDFASMPTVGEIWCKLRYDNFPLLFVALTRVWTLTGLNSDFSYRVLGFLVGTGTLGLLWWCARKLGAKTPLLVLALYAVNPMAIRVGDSMRPYGLGIALTLLTLTLIWNFVQTPGIKSLFWATLAAVLSVQCLYQNAFFIIAFSCGAWVVTLGRRQWKTALQTGIIGTVAALSLLPYWGIIKQGPMSLGIRSHELQFDTIWNTLREVLETSGGWLVTLLWLTLCATGLFVAVLYGIRQRRWGTLYCGTTLLLGVALYIGLLYKLALAPLPWYFLILMAPSALMVDAIIGGLDMWRLQIGRAVLSLIVIAACIPPCYAAVCLRQSNIDLVAAKLKEAAQPGDFIVVSPWFLGVSLHRYLDASRWTTLPPMDDVRIHRYDLEKKAMMTENPIGPVLDKLQAALRSGHRFWMAGDFVEPPGGGPPPVYPPYDGTMEYAEMLYSSSWVYQVTYFVEKHATEAHLVKIPVPGGLKIGSYENVPPARLSRLAGIMFNDENI